ncbi:hypothetical protein [Trinickia sp.]|uniref:hypothetical protein n=1 Tax=Trinickia sp. TaxID=2571163 RepID=UPI003F81A4A6
MTKKVYVKTFGCRMNEYDSDKMVDVLGAARSMRRRHGPTRPERKHFNPFTNNSHSGGITMSPLIADFLGTALLVLLGNGASNRHPR